MNPSGLDEIDFDYATSVAQKAQGLMAQHRVPPTPDNFAVWFKYALGTSAQLNMAMNVLIGNKRKFDPATNRDLYRAYVGGQAAERAIDLGVSEQLSTLMVSAQQYLATAIDDNRTQVRALGEVSAEASSGANPRRLIESLVRELSKATNRATALEANFAEASNELDKIRNSLEQAEERSKTDMLTGLANRRALDEFLRLAQISTMESGSALSVFLTDIDHFKSFNDNYGHQVGDQVIKLVAGVLREHVRDSDLAARYGGEELMAVLPGVDLGACREIAERITPGALQPFLAGSSDAFVTKLNRHGSGLIYSTIFGGNFDHSGSSASGADAGTDIAVNRDGHAYNGPDWFNGILPVTHDAFQPGYGGFIDTFVLALDRRGESMTFSSYLGGQQLDLGTAIAVDKDSMIYVAGDTNSNNFPTTNDGFQPTHAGGIFDGLL